MTKKRIKPKINSEYKNQRNKDSDQRDADGLKEKEKMVGVHILGKEDTQRHFGTPRANVDEKDMK